MIDDLLFRFLEAPASSTSQSDEYVDANHNDKDWPVTVKRKYNDVII